MGMAYGWDETLTGMMKLIGELLSSALAYDARASTMIESVLLPLNSAASPNNAGNTRMWRLEAPPACEVSTAPGLPLASAMITAGRDGFLAASVRTSVYRTMMPCDALSCALSTLSDTTAGGADTAVSTVNGATSRESRLVFTSLDGRLVTGRVFGDVCNLPICPMMTVEPR